MYVCIIQKDTRRNILRFCGKIDVFVLKALGNGYSGKSTVSVN